MVCKIFLSSEFCEKWWRIRRKWRKPANGNRFAFQANSININEFKCWPFMQTMILYLYNEKYSSKWKFKIIKSLIQSLGLVLLLLEALAFTLLAIIWKSMQIQQFSELLTEHWQYLLTSWVMVSFTSKRTLKSKF